MYRVRAPRVLVALLIMEVVSSIGRRGSSTGMSMGSTYVVTANRFVQQTIALVDSHFGRAGNDELEDAAVREESSSRAEQLEDAAVY